MAGISISQRMRSQAILFLTDGLHPRCIPIGSVAPVLDHGIGSDEEHRPPSGQCDVTSHLFAYAQIEREVE